VPNSIAQVTIEVTGVARMSSVLALVVGRPGIATDSASHGISPNESLLKRIEPIGFAKPQSQHCADFVGILQAPAKALR
jgi:hypothetical protein